ncbi:MAG: GspE/PulE family protein [Planctomycetota bacterium]
MNAPETAPAQIQVPPGPIERAPSKPRLGEQLVSRDLITEAELEAALQLQSKHGRKIGENLVELGIITEEQLLPFIAEQLGCPAVRLRDALTDPAAVRILPRATAQRLDAIALFKVRNQLTVAMADPQDLERIDEIRKLTGLRVRAVFAFTQVIEKMIGRCYEEDFAVDSVTADMDETAVEISEDMSSVDSASIENLVEGSPIINLVNYLILQAMRKGASDIHIEPSRKYTLVRFRIDGQLVEVLRPRRDIHAAVISRVKVMAKMDIAQQRIPQDGRCQVNVEGKDVDLRISTLPTVLGEKAVLRVLDRRRLTFNLDELGMPSGLLVQVKSLLAKPHGMMLVTGPTGSGKTTTLYSALELIKSVHSNIVTVEDPVEYQLELINQVQAEKSREFSFAAALRSILRQDPDVIMIGEIRDKETAEVAVQAALTGHLVLSTLHTNDAASAITRLTDMGIKSYKVAASLSGVIAQRLIRTVCPHCESTYYPSAEYLQSLNYTGDRRRTFTRGEGCKNCFDTGYLGRTGIYEVLTVEPEVRTLINEDNSLEKIRGWFSEQGGQTLLASALRLAEEGKTSLKEAARVAFFD